MTLTRRHYQLLDMTGHFQDGSSATGRKQWQDEVYQNGKPCDLRVTTTLIRTANMKRLRKTRTHAAMTVPVYNMEWEVRTTLGALLHHEVTEDIDPNNPTKVPNTWMRKTLGIG